MKEERRQKERQFTINRPLINLNLNYFVKMEVRESESVYVESLYDFTCSIPTHTHLNSPLFYG